MTERVSHANLKNMLSPTINSEQKGRSDVNLSTKIK